MADTTHTPPLARSIVSDFPFLSQPENKNLAYFDNAATTQKPRCVIEAVSEYYQHGAANVHRGVHRLADYSTTLWEQSRRDIAQFLGATQEELVVTRNATEALNGVAYGWGEAHIQAGDCIISTSIEHHANLVPWQELAKRKNAKLLVVSVDSHGTVDLSELERLLHSSPVTLVAISHISNVLGSVQPIKKIAALIKKNNQKYSRQTRLVVDGAQAVPHIAVDFHDLGADFYAFSGHKVYGPMGVGGLLVKESLLLSDEMKPWLFGGGMIEWVKSTESAFSSNLNDRYTAGTPDVASAAGLAAAMKYLTAIGMDRVEAHEDSLVRATWDLLSQIPEVTLIGPNPRKMQRVGSVAFVHAYAHAHDIAQVFNSFGIAVRSGHHCAMPLHTQYDWQATTRISFGVYNTLDEVKKLSAALEKINQMFR